MLKHVVMSRLKEKAGGKSRSENAVLLKQRLEGLKDKIPEIHEIEVGINISDSPTAFDLVLISTFHDKEDLEKYLSHPDHEKVAELLNSVRETRCVVDYYV